MIAGDLLGVSNPLVTSSEIICRFGLSASWFARQVREGRFPSVKVGRGLRFSPEAVRLRLLRMASGAPDRPITLYSISESVKLLNVPQVVLRDMIEADEVPHYVTSAGRPMLDLLVVGPMLASSPLGLLYMADADPRFDPRKAGKGGGDVG